MSMSEGGNEGLFRLAENAAPDPDRLMPSERTYAKSGTTVSLQEALSKMKARKAKEIGQIPGGLSDPSVSTRQKEEKTDPFEGFVGPDEMAPETPAKSGKAKATKSTKVSAQGIASILSALALLGKEVKALKELLPHAHSEDEEKEDRLEYFRKQRHRVTFRLNGMEFTVSCLKMVRDANAHTIVIPFLADTEAFFTPPQQSELKMAYDGQEIDGKLFYFGMSFTLPELGLRFLGFLYDDTEIGG